jgi:hypothetical protein
MILVYVLLSIVVTWALFLMYCALHASIRSGKFRLTPWPVRVLSAVLFAVMLVADVLFNLTVGSILFAEPPDFYHPTFTQRCSSHLNDGDWRGRIARWVCDGWLNPFEESHCR